MRTLMLAASAAATVLAYPAVATDVSISGTYKLVSEQRTIVDTNEVIPGTGARGYITYSDNGHMLVLIVRQLRPTPEGAEKITDQHGSSCSAQSLPTRGRTSSTAPPSSTTLRSR